MIFPNVSKWLLSVCVALGCGVFPDAVHGAVGWRIHQRIPAGNFPRSVVFLPNSNCLAVSHNGQTRSHFVYLVPFNQAGSPRAIPVLAGVHNSLAVGAGEKFLFVPNEQAGFVSMCQIKSGILEHRVFGKTIIQVANTADRHTLLVLAELETGASALFSVATDVFSTGQPKQVVLEGVASGWLPNAMIAGPEGRYVYIVSTPRPFIVPSANSKQRKQGKNLAVTTVDLQRMAVISHHELCLEEIFSDTVPQVSNRTVIPGGLDVGYAQGGKKALFIAHPVYGIFAVDETTASILWREARSDFPASLAYHPTLKTVLVACRSTDMLLVLDARDGQTVQHVADVSEDPISVTIHPSNGHVYVSGTLSDKLAVVKMQARAEKPGKTIGEQMPPSTPALRDRILFCGRKAGRTYISSLAPDGTDLRLHLETRGGVGACSFSPDGRLLAMQFHNSHGIDLFCFDWKTGELRQLTFRAAGKHSSEYSAQDMSWHPDRNRILFCGWRTHRDSVLYSIRADGTGEIMLYDDYQDHNDWPMLHPQNPDILLYLYDAGNWTYDRELRMINRLTGARHVLVPNEGLGLDDMTFLADGRLVATRSLGGYRTPKKLEVFNPMTGNWREIDRMADLRGTFRSLNPTLKQVLFITNPLKIGVIDIADGAHTEFPALPFEDADAPGWAKIPDEFLELPLRNLDPLL